MPQLEGPLPGVSLGGIVGFRVASRLEGDDRVLALGCVEIIDAILPRRGASAAALPTALPTTLSTTLPL